MSGTQAKVGVIFKSYEPLSAIQAYASKLKNRAALAVLDRRSLPLVPQLWPRVTWLFYHAGGGSNGHPGYSDWTGHNFALHAASNNIGIGIKCH